MSIRDDIYDAEGNMTDSATIKVLLEEKHKMQLMLEKTLAENERLKSDVENLQKIIDSEK